MENASTTSQGKTYEKMESDGALGSENTAPSTSPKSAAFSDEPQRTSSPPSSPPYFPWEQQEDLKTAAKVPQKPASNAFSILGKRKALESVSDNVQTTKRQRTTPPVISKSSKSGKSLTQMQISLGQEVQKRCKTCGMEYVASSTEDRKLHDKYHKQNTEGYDVGKDFVRRARSGSTYAGVVEGDWVCAVNDWDTATRKRRALAALEIVQRELGAVEIREEDLWGNVGGQTKYVAYMYVRGTKCVAFLLVQEIREAFRVEDPVAPITTNTKPDAASASREKDRTATSSLAALRARKRAAANQPIAQPQNHPLTLSTTTRPASLGISRIWTSPLHRKHSLATTLLNTAITHHNELAKLAEKFRELARDDPAFKGVAVDDLIEQSGPPPRVVIGKEDVAFSQPTEAGRRLAERWFGRAWGWGVYVD